MTLVDVRRRDWILLVVSLIGLAGAVYASYLVAVMFIAMVLGWPDTI